MVTGMQITLESLLMLTLHTLVFNLLLQLVASFFKGKLAAFNILSLTVSENLIKYTSVVSLLVSFIAYLFIVIIYLDWYSLIYSSYAFSYSISSLASIALAVSFLGFSFPVVIDFFGLCLLGIAYLTGFLSLLALDSRLFWKNNKYVLYFNIFILIVTMYCFLDSVLFFFLCYEFLMLPSLLIVYYVSPSKRSLQACIYFLVWTQIGSLLVLLAVSYILINYGVHSFSDIVKIKFTWFEAYSLYFLFFMGFGIKVPAWPFHYWLTKTHVEAPAGFSMYLSGFLVKTALYGFYKFTAPMSTELYTYWFAAIAVFGVLDSSIKMWSQTDLKKLVAYGTVQEMNLIYLVFLLGESTSIFGGVLFCITHSLLSALMFFLVDCIQRRYSSRYVVELSGILHITPNLGSCVFFMCLFFSGLPGTLKFSSEFIIFSGLFELGGLSFIVLIITANVFGLIGFLKCWFNVLFGFNSLSFSRPPLDLTIKDYLIILSCFALLVLINFWLCLYF